MMLLVLLLPLLSWAEPLKLDPKKKTVCTASITSNLQVQAFKDHLTKHGEIGKYQFVNLLNYRSKDDESEESWFDKACASGVTCDVLFMTGHFAGGFFGNSETGPQITSEKMREMSCTKKCENILRAPVEVFLFGCNTLAGKENDGRTPEEYFRVLTTHGMPAPDARTAVSMRYGIADTYKDQITAAFHGKKMLYGFDAPAPASVRSTPPFKVYLNKIGSYEKHFNKEVEKQLTGLVNDVDQTFKNTMKVSADQCRSMDSNDDKLKRLCELLYGNGTAEAKMDIVLELMQEDLAGNITLINMFFAKNKYAISQTKTFADLQKNEVIKSQLLNGAKNEQLDVALESLKAVNALKLQSEAESAELMSQHIARHLGSDSYKAEMLDAACGIIPCDIKSLQNPKMFNTDEIYNLPSQIRSMSPELEEALVKSPQKDASWYFFRVEEPGATLVKAIEARVPAATSAKDEHFYDYADFYRKQPITPKAVSYFISAVTDENKGITAVEMLRKSTLQEADKQKLKTLLPLVKSQYNKDQIAELLK